MKKIRVCLVLISLMPFPLLAQLVFKLSSDSLLAYNYTGGDEFNQKQLNENYWQNGLGWTRVIMSQDVAFDPRDVQMQNGIIRFIAEKKDSTYFLNPWEIDSNYLKKEKLVLDKGAFLTKYSVGCIISKQKMHYGFYELRFKVEEGRGVWPAFWFYGGNQNEEIDAFELKGERNNEIHVDTHCPTGCDKGYKDKFSFSANWGNWIPVSDYLHKGYNLMQLEWNPNEVIWYINGYPLAYFKGKFSNPMNLYLNTSVAKDGGAFKPGPDQNTKWPSAYDVDYVRIWQKMNPNTELVLKQNDALTTSIAPETVYGIKPLKKRGLTYKKTEFDKTKGLIYLSLSNKTQLTVRVMGKLSETATSILLNGNSINLIINDFNKELSFDLPASENELTLIVKEGKNEFQKRISLKK